MSRALASIGKKDLKEIIAEGKPVEMSCQFCNSTYTFTPEEIKKILPRGRQ